MDEIIVNNLPENTSPTAADKLMLIRTADGELTQVSVEDLSEVGGGGLTPAIKAALLQLAEKVAYIDANGQDYYDDLYDALYAVTAISVSPSSVALQTIGGTQQLTATTTPSGATVTWASSNTAVATVDANGLVTSVGYGSATITATAGQLSATCAVVVAQATVTSIDVVYTQSGTVYDTDSLDSLKDDLVVTAHWSNGTTSTVASADYTLSGMLTEGTSTITVSYGGITDTFVVNVTAAPTLSSITAMFTQGQTVVYDTDNLDSLKSMLVVTATYSDSSTQPVPSTDYTLSGTLVEGTSTVTVSYSGKTDTFTVVVSHDIYSFEWNYTDGLPYDNGLTRDASASYGSQTESLVNDGFLVKYKYGTHAYYSLESAPASILSSGHGVVEAKFYIPTDEITGKQAYAVVDISDGTNGVGVIFFNKVGENHTVKLKNGSSWDNGTTILNSWSYDTEYVITLEMDNGVGSVYINGTLVASDIDITTMSLSNVQFGVSGAGSNNNENGACWQYFKVGY